MSHYLSIDREEEIAQFDAMLAGKTREHILLVSAASGWGKSVLLREFIRRRPKNLHYAVLDFKSGNIGFAELLSRLCDALGWNNLPNLTEELSKSFDPIDARIQNNWMVGQNRIEVYLASKDEQEREMRQSRLVDKFFTDLRSLGRILLIFDSYEKCSDSIKYWLAGGFLSRGQHSPELFIVIAGQNVPEETIEWECIQIQLGGIHYEHWHHYAINMGLSLDIEFVRGCHSLCNGYPYQMKIHLDALIMRGEK